MVQVFKKDYKLLSVSIQFFHLFSVFAISEWLRQTTGTTSATTMVYCIASIIVTSTTTTGLIEVVVVVQARIGYLWLFSHMSA